VRFVALARRVQSAVTFVLCRIPRAYTLLEQLFVYRSAFREPGDYSAGFDRVRPELVPLEARQLLSGTPVPHPVIFAAAAGHVNEYAADTGTLNVSITPYAGYTGSLNVASGDLNGDGYPDVVTAPGAGGEPLVRVFDGVTGIMFTGALSGFLAFEPTYTGGVQLAVADVDGDGVPDIITAAQRADGPEIRVFSGADGAVLADFTVTGAPFASGFSLAAGDFTGAGRADVVVGGSGGWVSVYDPLSGSALSGTLGGFPAFGSGYTGGVVSVAADPLAGVANPGAKSELAVGTGAGPTTEVKVFDAAGTMLQDLTPFGASDTGGARVALGYISDPSNPTVPDVVVGSGAGAADRIRVFSGTTGDPLPGDTGTYTLYAGDTSGVAVAAANDPTVAPSPPSSPPPPPATGSIGTHVWYDSNADAVQDNGEANAPGVTVTLAGGTLTATETAVTDTSGNYAFTGLGPGTYTLAFLPTSSAYAYSVPIGGTELVTLAAGQTYTAANAGLVPPPVLDGEVVIAVKGQAYSGTVATVEGTNWPASSLSAEIQWGDGTETTGTLVSSGGTVAVTGTHTYTHEGAYALAVEVIGTFGSGSGGGSSSAVRSYGVTATAVPAGDDVAAFAAGLAEVLAPTDQEELEQLVGTPTASGGGRFTESSVSGAGTATVAITGSTGYALSESGNETEGPYTLVRTGSFSFSVNEVETTGFGQPNSTISMNLTESLSKSETVETPDQYGTATVTGGLGYTLTQTGTGASYTWAESNGTQSATLSQTVTQSDGTQVVTDTQSTSFAASGTNNAPGSTYSWASSGTASDARTETGYAGPETYTLTRSASGLAMTASGSGGFWNYTFGNVASTTGTYTQTESTSDPAGPGTETGGGSWSYSLSGSGTDPGGPVGFSTTTVLGFVGTATATVSGAVTTEGITRTTTDGVSVSGNEGSGTFTRVHSTTASETATAVVVNQTDTGTEVSTEGNTVWSSETATTGSGGYTLTGGSGDTVTTTGTDVNQGVTATTGETSTETAASTQTGNRFAGAYVLAETDTAWSTGSANSSQTSVQSAGGVTGTHALGAGTGTTETDTATLAQTGNLTTGAYTLHQTGTSSTSSTGTAQDNTTATATGGSASNAGSDTAPGSGSGTSTLDRTGNALSGAYTSAETTTFSSTSYATVTEGGTASHADLASASSGGGGTSTTYETDTSTVGQTGNEVTGSYSLHETDTSTSTVYTGGSALVAAAAADGSTGGDGSGLGATAYAGGTSTIDRTGNEVTGTYSLHETDTDGGTEYAFSTQVNTVTAADTSTVRATVTLVDTTYDNGTSTIDKTGGEITGTYSLHETDTSNATDFVGNTVGGAASEADGSSGGDGNNGTGTTYESGTSTSDQTGNEVTGAYSLHETDTSNATQYAFSTQVSTGTAADTSTARTTATLVDTTYDNGTGTLDKTGNEVTGTYSLHETDTSNATDFEGGTVQGGESAADGSTGGDGGTGTGTTYETGTATVNQTGNEVTGDYTLNEYDTSTSTQYAFSTRIGTGTAADTSTSRTTATLVDTTYDNGTSTISKTGNEVSGTYSLHETGTDGSTLFEGATAQDSGTGADGSTGGDGNTANNTTYETDTSTIDRTGNEVTGVFSLHETDTSTSTQYAFSTQTGSGTGADSSTSRTTATLVDTTYGGGTATIDKTGDEITGTYSLHEYDTDGSTLFEGATVQDGVNGVDGSTGGDGNNAGNTTYETGTATIDQTGFASGSYSLHEFDTSTTTEYDFHTQVGTVTAADTSTAGTTVTLVDTTYGGGTGTIDKTGSTASGSYTLVETDTDNSTLYEGATAGDAESEVDGSSGGDGNTASSTTYETGTATINKKGSDSTGVYSLHEYDTSNSTQYAFSTQTGSGTGADSSTVRSTTTLVDTTYETGTSTTDRTGNERTGVYSLHETGTSTSTLYEGGTAGGADSGADGSSDGDGNNASSTTYETDTSTIDRTGNESTGAYSLHEYDTSNSTQYAFSTQTGSGTGADSSTSRTTATLVDTTYETGTSTTDRTGNERTGVYSLHETDTDNSTLYEFSTQVGSETLLDSSTGRTTATLVDTTYETGTSAIDRTGNESTGTYSLHQTGTSTSTLYEGGTAQNAANMVGGATDGSGNTASSTTYETGTSTVDRTGNESTGTYSLHETDTSTATAYGTSSGPSTVTSAAASTNKGTQSGLATTYSTGTSTTDRTGNESTGTYSLHETDTSTATAYGTSSGPSTVTSAAASTNKGTQSGLATTYSTGTSTTDRTGNESTGTYSLHETDTSTATAYDGSGSQGTLSVTGSGDTDNAGATGTTYATDTSTTDRTGNESTGTYSLHQTGTSNSTAYAVSSDQNTVTATGGGTTGATDLSTSTVYDTGTRTLDRTGNESTGTYSLRETGTDTSTAYDADTDQGLTSSDTVIDVSTSTSTESGSVSSGLYTLSQNGTDAPTTYSAGSDSRGTFVATATSSGSSTTTGSGNRSIGASTSTVVETSTGTETRVGGSGANTYNRTTTWTDGSTATVTSNSDAGQSSERATDGHTATINETGTSSGTSYTLREVDGSSVTDTVQTNLDTGEQTSTHGVSTTASVTEHGSVGTGYYYDLTKTTVGYQSTSRTGDAETGQFTVSGAVGTTSTAVETQVHGTTGATFTEILTQSGTQSGTADDWTGEYSLRETGTQTANLVDVGSDSSGGFSVTEGSSGTYTQSTVGDTDTGVTQLVSSTNTGYNVTEVSSGATLVGTGTDGVSGTETGSGQTGAYSHYENGYDQYTLVENGTAVGGAFSQSVTGVDGYATTEVGNRETGTYGRTTVGDGYWTRVSSGAGVTLGSGSGPSAYTLTESGDAVSGSFGESETGADRYSLVDRFDNVSNTSSGATPGNITFHSHGLPFRDPQEVPSQLVVRADQAQVVQKLLKARAGVEVEIAPYDPNPAYVRLVLPASAQVDGESHNRIAALLASLGVTNATSTTGADTASDLGQAMRALYRGTVGAAPGGYSDRFLSLDPTSGAASLSAVPPAPKPATVAIPPGAGRVYGADPYQPGLPTDETLRMVNLGPVPGQPDRILTAIVRQKGVENPAYGKAVADRFDLRTLQSGSALTPIPPRYIAQPIDTQVVTLPQDDYFAAQQRFLLRWRVARAAESEESFNEGAGGVAEFLIPGVGSAVVFGDIVRDSRQVGDAAALEKHALALGLSAAGDAVPFVAKPALRVGGRLIGMEARAGASAVGATERAVAAAEVRGAVGATERAAVTAERGAAAESRTPLLVIEGGQPYTVQEFARMHGKTVEQVIADLGACFVAGTPLLTADGPKPIEQFRPGDTLLSREEHAPEGIVVARAVEAVFALFAQVIRLHVSGRVIGTTSEHPFWVVGKGWRPVRELAAGDRLVGHDGQEATVEKVVDTNEWSIVYNLRVAEFHTYFVGCDEWGFSVWAHNTCFEIIRLPSGEHALVRRGTTAPLEITPRRPIQGKTVDDVLALADRYGIDRASIAPTTAGGNPILARTAANERASQAMAAKPSARELDSNYNSYTNPGHHDPARSAGTTVNYNPTKSVLPPNHIELFEKSVPITDGSGTVIRWTAEQTPNGVVYHRFEPHLNGVYHWSGSTNGVTASGVARPLPTNVVPVKEIQALTTP